MFIDNELDLEEKLEFVETIHDDAFFKEETVALLHQEQLIRSDAVASFPEVALGEKRRFSRSRISRHLRPAGIMGAAVAAALFVVFLLVPAFQTMDATVSHRFVIYMPDVARVELAGSFNEWQRVPMEEIGGSGYWEVKFALPPGEHRFSYILEGSEKIADPTVIEKERDDFGGENSVILVSI